MSILIKTGYQPSFLLLHIFFVGVMLVLTRNQESTPVIYSSLSETMKSWTSCSAVSPLPRVVYFPTSKLSCCQRKPPSQALKLSSCYTDKPNGSYGATTSIQREILNMNCVCNTPPPPTHIYIEFIEYYLFSVRNQSSNKLFGTL